MLDTLKPRDKIKEFWANVPLEDRKAIGRRLFEGRIRKRMERAEAEREVGKAMARAALEGVIPTIDPIARIKKLEAEVLRLRYVISILVQPPAENPQGLDVHAENTSRMPLTSVQP